MSDAARGPSLVPALHWLPRYSRAWLVPDLLAGLTTAAVVVPKAMAFATIAGLPPQVGLYTAFVPLLVYAALGTSINLSVSTTTTIAILCAAALKELEASHSALPAATAIATLALLVGLLLVAARILRLGFLASFISDPVLTGFKAGIGLVIVVDQLPKLLGVHILKEGFLRDLAALAAELGHLSWATVAVSAASFAGIALLHAKLPRAPAPLVVLVGAIAASALLGLEPAGVAVVGQIPAGLPALVLPDQALVQLLWPAAAGIALMSFTESIAAGRAFHAPGTARIDADQELLAIGAANVLGSFFGAIPCGGGTSQTAVNSQAGAHSQVSGVVTAAVSLATMLFLAPALGALPYATLAAVVVAYSVGLIDPRELREVRRVRSTEFWWAVAALLGVVLLGTLQGILGAVVLSMAALVHQTNNPPVYALRRKPGTTEYEPAPEGAPVDPGLPGLLIVRIEGRAYFGNAQRIGDKLRALLHEARPQVLLLDCRALIDIEYTALRALDETERSARRHGVELWLAALNPGPLELVRRSALAARLGDGRMYPRLHLAVDAWSGRAASQGSS